ncbi:uncharacterized protein LOC129928768 [Biomphalaria glabrata]|uniref:Uncharacterized protein LOC129928768 n=1 Tax=Biomphalaria glabrata TaxID=6526 RepID=A0A9W3BM98_BIOGL|nr:uncharacterized protein LOC129928768 [Biomphalaria glabrata]
MLDSTPDLAHREQLSEVIRFVDVNFKTKKVTIKESFLGFIQLHAKDAATLENVIVEQLQADNLPIADCRSQCYDNAAVMAGELSGLQQRIAIRNPQASFVNCNNHSLNLAGLHAAKQDPVVVTFFVLSKIDRIQKQLQDPSMNFHDAALDLEGLQQRLSSIREDVCITAVNAAKVLCEKLGIRIEGRIKRRKQMPGENAGDAGLAAVEEITRIMKSVIDRLIQEMTTRFGRLKTLDEKFGFLFNISKLFANDTSNDIQQHCATLADFYKTDIDGTELFISKLNTLDPSATMKMSNGSKKGKRVVRYDYDVKILKTAIDELKAKKMTLRQASKTF